MSEVRKVSISKSEQQIAPNGQVIQSKCVVCEGDNFEECKKTLEELYK
jgi:hypothetical protein